MILLSPWWLLVLAAVAGSAVWALFRPARQLAVVGSLELWKQALARLDRSVLSRSRRISIAWWFLLAGAAVAGLALARPAWRAHPPARQIAVAVIPSAELGTPDEMRRQLSAFLDRLSGPDRVQLLLPDVLPSEALWLSPHEASTRVEALHMLPASAAELRLRSAQGAVQHTYVFAPAGVAREVAAGETLISIPTGLPMITIDAVGAVELPAAGSLPKPSDVQVFVAVRNHDGRTQDTPVTIRSVDDRGEEQDLATGKMSVPPKSRQGIALNVPRKNGYEVCFGSVPVAYLARQAMAPVKVALAGNIDPLVRRFVNVNPQLSLSDLKDAQLAIVEGAQPPEGVPAIVIDPPQPPPGWTRGGAMNDVLLDKVKVAAGHPVLADVELSGIVRRVEPWTMGEGVEGNILAGLDEGALIVERRPGTSSEGRARIYVTFDASAANCTWSMSPSFVLLLANAVDYLVPDAKPGGGYSFVRPLQAGNWRKWKRLDEQAKAPGESPLPEPGLYIEEGSKDPAVHAVSLVGLNSSSTPASGPSAAEVELVKPAPVGRDVEFWPALAILAGACWLCGWFLRWRE